MSVVRRGAPQLQSSARRLCRQCAPRSGPVAVISGRGVSHSGAGRRGLSRIAGIPMPAVGVATPIPLQGVPPVSSSGLHRACRRDAVSDSLLLSSGGSSPRPPRSSSSGVAPLGQAKTASLRKPREFVVVLCPRFLLSCCSRAPGAQRTIVFTASQVRTKPPETLVTSDVDDVRTVQAARASRSGWPPLRMWGAGSHNGGSDGLSGQAQSMQGRVCIAPRLDPCHPCQPPLHVTAQGWRVTMQV